MVRSDCKASRQHCGASSTVAAQRPLLLACADAEWLRQDSDNDTKSEGFVSAAVSELLLWLLVVLRDREEDLCCCAGAVLLPLLVDAC